MAASANLVVGAFDAVTAVGCAPGCTATASLAGQTSTTLSVAVTVTCTGGGGGGLSAGAIVGIVLGAGALGVLVAFGVALLRRAHIRNHLVQFESELKHEPDLMRRQATDSALAHDV